jgi:perosamine synthetase
VTEVTSKPPHYAAPIPISRAVVPPEAHDLVREVLTSGMLAQGRMVERLEAAFADLCAVPHAIAVNNGTTALVAALQAVGLRPGDEVITTPFSFVATLNAILEAGATVRFGDIGPDFNLDPAAVEPLIGPRTRAIMPVHLYGLPADMAALTALADRHGLAVVEDAAQAVGAACGDRPVGSFGTGCFSLYATKNITSGEGGVVTTSDSVIADRLRLLRNQGMRTRYQYEIAGHNYRMTDLQAAVALPQLTRLAELNRARTANAERLTAGLAGLPGLITPAGRAGRTHVWHQYTARVTPAAPLTRDRLAESLAADGVGSGVYYPRLMHDYPCYAADPRVRGADPTPFAAEVTRETLSLPVHPALSADDLDRVVAAVHRAFDR